MSILGGNVGIDTTSPDGKLHIKTSGTTIRPNILLENSWNNRIFGLDVGNDGCHPGLFIGNMNNTINRCTPDKGIEILENGNVGIGTTNPENTLHVNGAINLNPTSEPSNPSTGFILYCDSSDGKLKAKSSSGTITILANP
jgi:hypothetical protein